MTTCAPDCRLDLQGDAPVYFNGTLFSVVCLILRTEKGNSSEEVVRRPLLPVLCWEPLFVG